MENSIIRFFLAPLVTKYIKLTIDWNDIRVKYIIAGTFATFSVLLVFSYIFVYSKIKDQDDEDKNIEYVESY